MNTRQECCCSTAAIITGAIALTLVYTQLYEQYSSHCESLQFVTVDAQIMNGYLQTRAHSSPEWKSIQIEQIDEQQKVSYWAIFQVLYMYEGIQYSGYINEPFGIGPVMNTSASIEAMEFMRTIGIDTIRPIFLNPAHHILFARPTAVIYRSSSSVGIGTFFLMGVCGVCILCGIAMCGLMWLDIRTRRARTRQLQNLQSEPEPEQLTHDLEKQRLTHPIVNSNNATGTRSTNQMLAQETDIAVPVHIDAAMPMPILLPSLRSDQHQQTDDNEVDIVELELIPVRIER